MPAAQRKGKEAASEQPVRPPRGSGRKRKEGGSLMWLWILGGVILLIVAGSMLPAKSEPPASRGPSASGQKVASKLKSTNKIERGAMVDVVESFETMGKPPQRVEVGWSGSVVKLDEDGDALVDFASLEKRAWVSSAHFDKLKVSAEANPAALGSNVHHLKLTLRLKELTELATKLKDTDELTAEVADAFNVELEEMEAEIRASEGKAEATRIRDLLSMISVLRGMTIQHSQNLTDDEVEALNNSWTYANPRYWDDYYNKTTSDERYDWYGSWDSAVRPIKNLGADIKDLGGVLSQYISKQHQILHWGCGNSDISEKMYRQGFENIVNIDVSQSLMDGLKARLQAEMPRMQWLVMSGEDLKFADDSFDIILDKGSFDAVEQNARLLSSCVKEVHRTLKPSGYFISVSFRDEVARVQLQLEGDRLWRDCQHHVFERSDQASTHTYHVHACRKK